MSGKTVKDFLIEQMKEHGYTALYCQDADNCGCFEGDLFPCGGDPLNCEMAYTRKCVYDSEKCSEDCEGKGGVFGKCATTKKPEEPTP